MSDSRLTTIGDELSARVDRDWRVLVERFRWTFVEDADVLLAQVSTALRERHGAATITDRQIHVEIQQHYNQRLYAAFLHGRLDPGDDAAAHETNRACKEIWLAAWRQVLAKGYDEQTAEDLAQQVVKVLLENPYNVRVPGSLSAWVMYKVMGLLAGLRDQRSDESLDQATGMTMGSVLPDPTDPVERVEEALLAREVMNGVMEALSTFQQQLIRLVVVDEYSHKEIAQKYGVAESRIRIEKARALHKIRAYLKQMSV